MSLLQPLATGQGYLKAGLQGFQKSGKTYTAALLACVAKKQFKVDGPIAMYDTEGGSTYIGKMVQELTGAELVGVRSRSFTKLIEVARECEAEGVEILLVDSVSHIWRELCDTFLRTVNAQRKAKGQMARTRLEFQDWNPIKAQWAEWTDWYLNSKCHVIICGRAGYEYDFEENDETGRKELIKTGVKMKTEGEFGFEPSLLVEMSQEQKRNGNISVVRRAIVLGDRFGLIDGATVEFAKGKNLEAEAQAVADFFGPHLNALTPGTHAVIDSEKSHLDIDEDGQAEYYRDKRQKTILLEEIKGELLKAWPSTSAAEKQAKQDCIELVFGTTSWTKVEGMSLSVLREGLDQIKEEVALVIGNRDLEEKRATKKGAA